MPRTAQLLRPLLSILNYYDRPGDSVSVVGGLVPGGIECRGAVPITATGPVSDEGFNYSTKGEIQNFYEATPNSGGFYTLCARYWESGISRSLSCLPGIPYLKYGNDGATLDGEGRPTSVWAQSGQSPVTAVSYVTSGTTQPIGVISQVTYGS